MRSSRVFYLLLSILQFILFLKLIEIVRGDELHDSADPSSGTLSGKNGTVSVPTKKVEGGSREFYLAPKIKRKKFKPWNGNESEVPGAKSSNATVTKRIPDTNSDMPSNKTRLDKNNGATSLESGRLCPGCENNQCAVTDPLVAGFPIVPFVIAVIIGIKWFIIFLIIWVFIVRSDKHHHESDYGGYGGGYGSPQPGWSSNSDSSSLSDIFHKIPFLGDKDKNQRSLQDYASILNRVIDSVSKLTALYNET